MNTRGGRAALVRERGAASERNRAYPRARAPLAVNSHGAEKLKKPSPRSRLGRDALAAS